MKCPFVERECIKRECAGWTYSGCFVENLSQKLDTLCNLVSSLCARPIPLSMGGAHPEPEGQSPRVEVDEPPPAVPEKPPKPEGLQRFEPINPSDSITEAVIAFDFGTALSKVAVRVNLDDMALPIPLAARASEILNTGGIESYASGNPFVQDSLIYVDDSATVYCGSLARQRFVEAANAGIARLGIQNLKQLLIGGGAGYQIHSSHFPSDEKMDLQAVLSTYMAYLFYLTRTYLNTNSDLRIDVNATLRNFSIPVWNNKEYRESVIRLMERAIASAYCLEKWLQEELIVGVPMKRLRDALVEAEKYHSEIQQLVGTDVSEPVAAGFSRICDLEIRPGLPVHLFVVDIGSGSTDFALLTISQPRNREGVIIHTFKQSGVDAGVAKWDNALRALLLNKLREKAGLTTGHPQLQLVNAKIDAQLMQIKENVIRSQDGFPVDVSPALSTPIVISKSDLEAAPAVQDALSTIRAGLEQYICDAREWIANAFAPDRTEILVTGGGSFLQSVVSTIRESVHLLGPSYPNRVNNRFIPSLYSRIPNFRDIYPLVAVSLGSTEREYPEQRELPRIGPDPGAHRLGGYFTTGL